MKGMPGERWYVRVERAFFIVPLEFDSDKEFTFPVYCYVVIFFQCVYEMVGVTVALELDSKIFNYKCYVTGRHTCRQMAGVN